MTFQKGSITFQPKQRQLQLPGKRESIKPINQETIQFVALVFKVHPPQHKFPPALWRDTHISASYRGASSIAATAPQELQAGKIVEQPYVALSAFCILPGLVYSSWPHLSQISFFLSIFPMAKPMGNSHLTSVGSRAAIAFMPFLRGKHTCACFDSMGKTFCKLPTEWGSGCTTQPDRKCLSGRELMAMLHFDFKAPEDMAIFCNPFWSNEAAVQTAVSL